MQTAAGCEAVEAVAVLRAAFDRCAATDLSVLGRDELLALLSEYEALGCQLPALVHRLLAALQQVAQPRELGAKNWKEVLALRLRISTADAHRRLAAAKQLGPRTSGTGQPLAPEFAAVAAAQEHGLINAEHVSIIVDTVTKVRARVDAVTAAQVELELVRTAVRVGPKELEGVAALRLVMLDQDGPEPDDRERQKARGVRKGKQRRDGTTPITAQFSPEAMAVWEPIFAKFAAPGMCNPDDPQPCVSGTPSQAQIDNDHRSVEQRQHDAMVVVGRIALMADLGTLNGLPVSAIITTTLQELQAMAGVATSGGGTTMPIAELIRMGAHAYWSLAVFDGASGSALELFRTRRTASAAQRIMLIGRDKGCTKPGCPVGPYGCQVHHAVEEWTDGGNTNVDENALACGPDNRLVGPGPEQYGTDVIDGVAHWYPPEQLDTGQATVNYLHRPELIPLPDEDAPLPWETAPAASGPAGDTPEPLPDNATPETEPQVESWDGISPPFDETPWPRPDPSAGSWDPDTPPFPPDDDAPPSGSIAPEPLPDNATPSAETEPQVEPWDGISPPFDETPWPRPDPSAGSWDPDTPPFPPDDDAPPAGNIAPEPPDTPSRRVISDEEFLAAWSTASWDEGRPDAEPPDADPGDTSGPEPPECEAA